MARSSTVHYIAPSAIGITPNCNGSENDLDVYLARRAKIKVYSPDAGIGYEDSTYQEWTLKGRNRRLGDSAKPYTIYARLSKYDKGEGYLVFAPKNGGGDNWTDKYDYLTALGMEHPDGGVEDADNWYVRLGDVSLPEAGKRTVSFDTGILGTDQYWTEEDEIHGKYISKVDDDEAHGLIGFLKGIWVGIKDRWGWTADGDITANNIVTEGNVNVGKILRAYNAYINKVQSTNFTGNGLLDTGWRIINDYEGSNSAAVFDYLTIRKKAFFNELEIRKLSSIGGNFCMSPASGKIYRVEWYGADGELQGYDYYNVPWTVGSRLLGLFSKSLAQRFLGKRKRLARRLTPEERAAMRTIRCYFFTDDGSTQSMLNWTVGAQARCQTFNIESQMDHYSGGETDNPDVGFYDSDHRGEEYRTETDMYGGTEFYRGHKVQNTYWWRLVTAVGKGKLEDGKVHYYIEFSVNTGSDRTHEDAGSDLPSVGDQVVQMGHRTRTDQQNVIMIETASEDAPAIKMYDGINSWDLTGRLVARMSPKGWRVVANRFEWLTEYGEKGVTINRGLWVDIAQQNSRQDFTVVYPEVAPLVPSRRCYYNDVVSHNGSYWRCIVASGTHKENDDGYWFLQAEIDRMSLEEQLQLHDVQNYTTVEPGDATFEQRAVWQMEVSIGISPYLVIEPAMIAVPCEKDGRATAAYSVSASVKLMVTNVDATITSITMTGADAHVSLQGNFVSVNIPAGASVANKDYTLTVEGTCNGQRYTATDKVSVYAAVKGNDAYEVTALPMNWLWNQEGANYSTEDIRRMIDEGTSPSDFPIQIDKVEQLPDGTMGNSCTQLSVVNGGVAQQFQIVSVTTSDRRVTASFNNVTGRVWVTQVPNTLESGWVDCTVRYGAGVTHTLRIPFWCNLLGTWREIIFGDTRYAIAEKTAYLGRQYTQFHAEYEQSSQAATQHFTKIDGIIGQNGEKVVSSQEFGDYKQSASENYASLQREVNGKLNTSEFKQTADSFSLCTTTQASDYATGVGNDIKTRLSQTGILIDGNNRKIELQADHTVFKSSAGDNAKIWIDTNDGSLHAVDGDFSGKITSQSGHIGGFGINKYELYGYNGSIWLEGGDPDHQFNLVNNGASSLKGIQLGTSSYAGNQIIPDSDRLPYTDRVYHQQSLVIASGAVVLPTWPPKGWIFFIKVCSDTTVSVANPSRMRIYRAGGDVVTSMDADYKSLMFVKLGNMNFNGNVYDTWCEFYCG